MAPRPGRGQAPTFHLLRNKTRIHHISYGSFSFCWLHTAPQSSIRELHSSEASHLMETGLMQKELYC